MYASNLWGQSQADLPQVRRDKLKGTQLEAMMVTPDIMAMGGAAPATDWTSLSEAEKDARLAAALGGGAAGDQRSAWTRCARSASTSPTSPTRASRAARLQIANDPSIPNADPEAMRQQLRKDIFLAVTLHEVGHNMGLRHNFRASFDALNYFPQYWELRSAAAANPAAKKFAGIDVSTKTAIGVPYTGTDCNLAGRQGTMRPRYVDCPGGATSVDEVMGNVREYQYSSVMDYGAEFNSDLNGPRPLRQGGDEVQLRGRRLRRGLPDGEAGQQQPASVGVAVRLPELVRLPVAAQPGQHRPPGHPVHHLPAAVQRRRRRGIDKRVDVPYSDITPGGPGGYVLSDTLARPMVPYYFCSDEFVGNLTCQRFDSGADAFEQAQDLVSRYKNFYLLNNFKRDRYTFHTSLSYKDRDRRRATSTCCASR